MPRAVWQWVEDGMRDELEAQAEQRSSFELRASKSLARKVYEANPVAIDPTAAAATTNALRKVSKDTLDHYKELWECTSDHKLVKEFFEGVVDVHVARPFFIMPKIEAERHTRLGVARRAKDPKAMLKKSVFAGRAIESDSRSFYDNETMQQKRMMLDWRRALSKGRFLDFVKRSDKDSFGAEDLKEEFDEIGEIFNRYFTAVGGSFTFFCAAGKEVGEGCYSMKLNQFNDFCRECNITDPQSEHCKQAHLDRMFIAVNYEEDKTSEISVINNDVELTRFEWLEMLTRLAVAKYGLGQRTDDVSDAVEILLEENLNAHLPPECLVVTNEFRNRLYDESVLAVFTKHAELLRTIFNFMNARDREKAMSMANWLRLMEMGGLVNERTDISLRQAKLSYIWSQMLVMDEVFDRYRLVTLTFCDFMESLARVADAMSPQPREELLDWVRKRNPECEVDETAPVTYMYFAQVGRDASMKNRRPSGGLVSGKTRPLADKLEQALEVLFGNLLQSFKCASLQDLTKVLKTQTKLIKQGTI